jgi:hypothetical protein
MGTPAYMSPEQADGRPADERADLFSLGVVLYHAAAGDSPFLRASTTATLNAVGNHTPPDVRAVNAAVPPALAELILRLLSKEPTARPTSAAAVAAALRRMEPSTPAPTDVVGPRRPSRFRRMRRWPWWAGGVTALVLVGILVWAATRPTRAAVVRWECQFTRQALVGPLSPGDTAQLWVGLNRPAHVYVLWFNADGTVDRWYPWARDGTRERIGDAPAASFERRYTLAGGPAGLETIVILVRATRLPGDDPFPPRIDVRPPADPIALVHHRPVKTRNGEPVELDRGAAAEADPLAPAGPVLDLCRAWRAQGVCDDFVTVTFAVTGGR